MDAGRIKVRVKNIEAMIAFYEKKLGAELIDHVDEYACLSWMGSVIELSAGYEGGMQYIALEADDITSIESLSESEPSLIIRPLTSGYIADGKQLFSCDIQDLEGIEETNKPAAACSRIK